ncbi:hypothetical protein [Skermanella pratensis]|uniref:hypothetical protein n=1 Tax=Skermanella pratensis TaxID=2233999 RepID=UPI0013014549|nr:hypothetical protein [Skermanella pratensis]
MRSTALGAALAAGVLAVLAPGGARAQDVKETVCAQGTYSEPCPQVIWCPATNCGIGIPQPDGGLEIISSTEKKMDGTSRRPVQAGKPMTLESITGRVIVFEWEDAGQVGQAGSDLTIKDILYVVMPPAGSG